MRCCLSPRTLWSLLTLSSRVHPSSSQYQCRWKAEDYVRSDQNKGCRSSILQPSLQESRCRLEQAVSPPSFASPSHACASTTRVLRTDQSKHAVPVKSHRKSWSVSSPSSKTLPNTKSLHGSSIANATLLMAKTLRCWQITWTASYVRIWSA